MINNKTISLWSIILIVLCSTVKDVHSVTCYVCDNCVNVDTSTSTQTNCGACVKSGLPRLYMKRQCVETCSDIQSKFPIQELLSCCTTDLCNNSKQLKPFITVGLIIYAVWNIFTCFKHI